MRKRSPQFYPTRLSQYVPNLPYIGNSEGEGMTYMNLGTPVAGSATAIATAISIATGSGSLPTVLPAAQSEAIMGRWGRALVVVADGAATSLVTVIGRDYLGQVVREDFTLNGTTPVQGNKAFRYVDGITFANTASRSINIGTTNKLGLPYKGLQMITEMRDRVAVTGGTFVAGAADTVTQTSTTADPRGTYTPSSAPNGTADLQLRVMLDTVNGHGNPHFGG
jgi:hypothetical protein